jgi:hypothetical protein
VQSYGLSKRFEAVKNCRSVTKKDMKWNDATPKMSVDPESYEVYVFCFFFFVIIHWNFADAPMECSWMLGQRTSFRSPECIICSERRGPSNLFSFSCTCTTSVMRPRRCQGFCTPFVWIA